MEFVEYRENMEIQDNLCYSFDSSNIQYLNGVINRLKMVDVQYVSEHLVINLNELRPDMECLSFHSCNVKFTGSLDRFKNLKFIFMTDCNLKEFDLSSINSKLLCLNIWDNKGMKLKGKLKQGSVRDLYLSNCLHLDIDFDQFPDDLEFLGDNEIHYLIEDLPLTTFSGDISKKTKLMTIDLQNRRFAPGELTKLKNSLNPNCTVWISYDKKL